MQLGVGLPSYSSETHSIPQDRFRRFARQADEYRFAGAWVIEHLSENPNYATSLLDPLTTLSIVAGETKTLPVGTSVLLLPLRNPVLVAKRAVSLQHLSSRQLTLGFGTGYVRREYDAVGIPMEERSKRFLEGIELIRRLFEEREVTFEGEFYSIKNFRLEPNLGQPPRILTGGAGVDTDEGRRIAAGVKERLRFADGWIAPPRPIDVIKKDWRILANYLELNGKLPERFEKVALQYLHLVPGDDRENVLRTQRNAYRDIVGANRTVNDATKKWLTGSVNAVRSTLKEFENQGFDEVILYPIAHSPKELDRQLHLYQKFLLPEFS